MEKKREHINWFQSLPDMVRQWLRVITLILSLTVEQPVLRKDQLEMNLPKVRKLKRGPYVKLNRLNTTNQNRKTVKYQTPQKISDFKQNERYAKIGVLMENARQKSEELFEELNIRYSIQGRRFVGYCPVHGGHGGDSFNYYPDGYKSKAFWQCLSNHCESHFKGNIIGLVRGVLSRNIYDWEKPTDKEATYQDAIDFLCNFLKTPWEDLKPDFELAERNKFLACVEVLTMSTPQKIEKGICSKEKLRNFLEIPAEYYINRGFKPETLDKFDVGLCLHPESELYGRVVIPFYHEDSDFVSGCIGRSIYEECSECHTYHNPLTECLSEGSRRLDYCKVRTAKGFKSVNVLYNYWNAKKYILKMNRCAVIVEGCADLWKLDEAGIPNVMALNGSTLSEAQQVALECSGATEIICLTDNDEAGERAYAQIAKRCHFAKTIKPIFDGHDIGELSVENIKQYDFYKYLRSKIKDEESNNNRVCR